MNVLEYIEELMDNGYSEEDAEITTAYMLTSYYGEED